jgi:S1-C subfamily serine protease
VDRTAAIDAAIDVRGNGCGPRVGFGTGAVIPGGDIVTAAHVVAGASSVDVISVANATASADVILFDPDLDVAVLRPSEPIGTPLALRADDARRDEVGIVVLPRQTEGAVEIEVEEVSVVRTANISTTDIYLETDVVRQGFEIAGAIEEGDSGAMVVLPGGGVGIVWARSNRNEGRAWAVDLPSRILDGSLTSGAWPPVDVGACIRS